MKVKIAKYTTIIFGFLLLAIGLYLIKTGRDSQGVMRALPYICIGFALYYRFKFEKEM